MPLLYYDGAFFFSPNGYESGIRVSDGLFDPESGGIDWSAAVMTVFTASQGPGLLLELGLGFPLVEKEGFELELRSALAANYVYHVLGSGSELGLGLRLRCLLHLPLSDDYSFFLGSGIDLEARYLVGRWIGAVVVPLTAGFRYRF